MPAQSLVKATNQIIVFGEFKKVEMKVGANATAAKMIPGTLVIRDTNDNQVKEAGAKAHGIFGVIDVDPTHGMSDNYALGENIPILVPLNGSFLMIRIAANENVTQGDTMVSAADGLIAAHAVGAMGSQGDIVGQVWETWNVAAIEHVLVKWLYTPELKAAA